MAIEDAACLGTLFSHLTDVRQIPELLRAYEGLRYERTTKTQESSRLNQWIFHLQDGEEQRVRDESMREAMVADEKEQQMRVEGQGFEAGAGPEFSDNANQWADKSKSREQFLYDADAEAERWWKANESRLTTMNAAATEMSMSRL